MRLQIVACQLSISQHLAHESGTEVFAGVNRYDRASPIWMAEEMVAALHAKNVKTKLLQSRNELLAGNGR